MRILIILPDYYPKQNPRVFRWQALAEHWAAIGWEVGVLCASHSKYPAMENVQGVKVHRIGQASMMDLVYNMLNKENRRREIQEGEPTRKGKMDGIVSVLGTFFHWVWKNIYWPDGACLWIAPAKKKAVQLLKTNNYGVVISVSLPFSSHLVGLSIKQRFPKTAWIVDIGDPFSTLEEFPKNNLLFYNKRNHTVESRVLKQVDAVCLTSHGAVIDYQRNFPGLTGKIYAIPPLYVITKREQSQINSVFILDKINIGYFGSFYAGIRQPEMLLELFSQLINFKPDLKNRLALHIFGYLEPEFQKTFKEHDSLDGCLFLHGQIDKSEVNQMMTDCDFLVNVGNATASQLPSKSVDYMMTGKPIINICQRPDDTFRLFLQDYPLILNLLGENRKFSKQQIEKSLDFLVEERGKRVGENWLKRKAEEFGVETIAKQYERLMVRAD